MARYRLLIIRSRIREATLVAAWIPCLAGAAFAKEDEEGPRRTRVGVGMQLVPSFPGADEQSVRPLFDVARTRGDKPYAFEAPDESFGFSLLRSGNFAAGPAVGIQGSRDAKDVGAAVPKVGFTLEAGGFAQYAFSEDFRARLELRKGFGGHKGLISNLGVDFISREGNKWLLSIGPRLTLADNRYQDAYFSVAPQDAIPSGLPAYDADGGVQSAGAAVGYIQQFSPRWGLYSYAKYDRLLGDAVNSPIVRQLGSRDQFSGGLAITYTFGRLK